MVAGNAFIDTLVVDDEEDICELVSGILSDNGYSTRTAFGYGEAIKEIEKKIPQLVILDVWLGEGDRDGIRLLQYAKAQNPHLPVIMMSGHGTIDTAVTAIQKGAYDFIEKPFEPSRLLVSVSKALESASLQKENESLKVKAKVTDSVLGSSSNVREINLFIERVAPLNGRCLITGHKCSDKEDIARKIHNSSPRVQAQFCSINCSQCDARYLELELFGSEILMDDKAQISRGLLEQTNGGTLFIDNIESLPHEVQFRLLNAFISNSYIRVGGKQSSQLPLNSRVIAGTSINLVDAVNDGVFNKELYYHIGVNKVSILPLNKRVNDIPILIQHYLNQMSAMYSVPNVTIDPSVVAILKGYNWQNDMVELRSVVDWIFSQVISRHDKTMTVYKSDLPPNMLTSSPVSSVAFTDYGNGATQSVNSSIVKDSSIFDLGIKEAKERFEREYYVSQLKKYAGNIQRTSEIIGMDRSALYRRLKHLKIK